MQNNIFSSATSFIRYDRLQLGVTFISFIVIFFHLFNISCLIIALIVSIQVERRVFLSGLCVQATVEQMHNKKKVQKKSDRGWAPVLCGNSSPINLCFSLPPGPWASNRACLLVTPARRLTSNRRVGVAAVVAYWAAPSSWQQKAVVALGRKSTDSSR